VSGAAAAESQSFHCLLEPHEIVKVGSPIAGILEEVAVDRGDVVKQGQVLAQLESRVEQAALVLAEERAKFGRRKVERNEDLYEKNLMSINEKDELETDSQLAELELRRSQAELARRTIISPLSGVVVKRFLAAGEYVQDAPILEIAQLNPLNVEVILPVSMYGQVKNGMEVKVYPQEPVGGEYIAKVVIVDRVVDAASGTIGVRLQLANPGNRLPSGLKCQVSFD
jgi:RND family efflux transporter MFP subunit